jgi:SRSO17 transposase
MTAVRPAPETVAVVDAATAASRDLVHDVRSFDPVTRLQLGLIRDLARTSLPAIGRIVGTDPHALQQFIANADWEVPEVRHRRLQLTRDALRGRSFVLCLDATGDQTSGSVTDDGSRQSSGNLGPVEPGRVSVTADGGRDAVTFPLRFPVFTPDRRLKPTDTYATTPSSASPLIRTLGNAGCALDLVRADAVEGERGPVLDTVYELGRP